MLLARGAGRRPVLASPAMVASSRCCCACSLRTSPMRRPGARCTRLGAVRSDRNAAIMRIRAASQLATPARFIRFCLERVPPITLSSFPPFPFFFERKPSTVPVVLALSRGEIQIGSNFTTVHRALDLCRGKFVTLGLDL